MPSAEKDGATATPAHSEPFSTWDPSDLLVPPSYTPFVASSRRWSAPLAARRCAATGDVSGAPTNPPLPLLCSNAWKRSSWEAGEEDEVDAEESDARQKVARSAFASCSAAAHSNANDASETNDSVQLPTAAPATFTEEGEEGSAAAAHPFASKKSATPLKTCKTFGERSGASAKEREGPLWCWVAALDGAALRSKRVMSA